MNMSISTKIKTQREWVTKGGLVDTHSECIETASGGFSVLNDTFN